MGFTLVIERSIIYSGMYHVKGEMFNKAILDKSGEVGQGEHIHVSMDLRGTVGQTKKGARGKG